MSLKIYEASNQDDSLDEYLVVKLIGYSMIPSSDIKVKVGKTSKACCKCRI